MPRRIVVLLFHALKKQYIIYHLFKDLYTDITVRGSLTSTARSVEYVEVRGVRDSTESGHVNHAGLILLKYRLASKISCDDTRVDLHRKGVGSIFMVYRLDKNTFEFKLCHNTQ